MDTTMKKVLFKDFLRVASGASALSYVTVFFLFFLYQMTETGAITSADIFKVAVGSILFSVVAGMMAWLFSLPFIALFGIPVTKLAIHFDVKHVFAWVSLGSLVSVPVYYTLFYVFDAGLPKHYLYLAMCIGALTGYLFSHAFFKKGRLGRLIRNSPRTVAGRAHVFKVLAGLLVANFYAGAVVCTVFAFISAFIMPGLFVVFLVGVFVSVGVALPGLLFFGLPALLFMERMSWLKKPYLMICGAIVAIPSTFILFIGGNPGEILNLKGVLVVSVPIGIMTGHFYHCRVYRSKKEIL